MPIISPRHCWEHVTFIAPNEGATGLAIDGAISRIPPLRLRERPVGLRVPRSERPRRPESVSEFYLGFFCRMIATGTWPADAMHPHRRVHPACARAAISAPPLPGDLRCDYDRLMERHAGARFNEFPGMHFDLMVTF